RVHRARLPPDDRGDRRQHQWRLAAPPHAARLPYHRASACRRPQIRPLGRRRADADGAGRGSALASRGRAPGLRAPMRVRDGWPLVWSLALAQLVSWGSIYYSFSLFVGDMEAELGWGRPALNGALSLGLMASGLAAYPVGAWIDRHGGRAVMTAGSLLGAALLLAWSQIHSLVGFYLLWLGLGLALSATLYDPVFAVVTRRFPHSYRTRITALTLIGGFASTVFIPLTKLFIDTLGWRHALV